MTNTMAQGWVEPILTSLEGEGRRPLIEFVQQPDLWT